MGGTYQGPNLAWRSGEGFLEETKAHRRCDRTVKGRGGRVEAYLGAATGKGYQDGFGGGWRVTGRAPGTLLENPSTVMESAGLGVNPDWVS